MRPPIRTWCAPWQAFTRKVLASACIGRNSPTSYGALARCQWMQTSEAEAWQVPRSLRPCRNELFSSRVLEGMPCLLGTRCLLAVPGSST